MLTLEQKRKILESAGYKFEENVEHLYRNSNGTECTKYICRWVLWDITADFAINDIAYCITCAWEHYITDNLLFEEIMSGVKYE